jgi:hypothetical protein
MLLNLFDLYLVYVQVEYHIDNLELFNKLNLEKKTKMVFFFHFSYVLFQININSFQINEMLDEIDIVFVDVFYPKFS